MKHLDSKASNLLVFLVSLTWIVSCTPTMNVQSSFDRSTNFRQYRTFDWYPAADADNLESKTGYDTEVDRRIKTAVAAELVKKGIRPNAEAPGFLVAYDIAIDTSQVTSEGFAPGFGYGYAYWYGYRYNYDVIAIPNYRSINQYPRGTLIIDLIDPESNELIWSGSAESEIEPAQTDERKIRRAVANILLQFPPAEAAMPTR